MTEQKYKPRLPTQVIRIAPLGQYGNVENRNYNALMAKVIILD
jgi:hypothetical protein